MQSEPFLEPMNLLYLFGLGLLGVLLLGMLVMVLYGMALKARDRRRG